MKHVDPTSSSLDNEDKEYREVSLKTMKAGRWFFIASLVVLCGIIIYYTTVVLNILSIPIGIILWSVVIVFCLRGIVDGLEKRGANRLIGTIVAYLVMLLVLAACIFLMFSPLFGVGNQFDSLIQSVPTYISQVSEWWNHVYEQYAEFFQDATIKEYMSSAFASLSRSEERRVGKECRSRWSPYH